MTFDEYQQLAIRTKNSKLNDQLSIAVNALGLVGEAGEVADYLKKVVGHNHPIDRNKLVLELGDVLWYVASLCDEYQINMEAVATRNITKLQRRYPEGFSTTDSLNRVDTDPSE